MSLSDFMLAHRDEILEAYRAELGKGRSLSQVTLDLQAKLWEMTQTTLEPASVERPPDALSIVGDSLATSTIRTRIDQLSSRSRAPVLICGDAGVGKRHSARALHHATYPKGFWLDLDDPAKLPELERRLLAIRKSTSVEAEVGTTIYVHQVLEAPVAIHSRLAKLLREESLPLRVIVSSGQPPRLGSRDNSLQTTLGFRFANELRLLPLSERKRDIAPLVRHFAALHAARGSCALTTFSPEAMAVLSDHAWPGNIVELAHFIEQLVSNLGPGEVDAGDLPVPGDRPSGVVLALTPSGIDLAELERQLLVQALALADNNQTRAGALLGLTRDQIRYRMAKFDLWASGARGG